MAKRAKRRTYRSATQWPSWTDEVAAGVGPGTGFSPSPEDAAWAAEELGGYDADEVPDEVLDREAELAPEVERHERGFRA